MNYLVSFADSTMRRSLQRLSKQAEEMHFFDGMFLSDESALSCVFNEKFRDKLLPGSRGYGYWSWKPEVIFNSLETLSDGDCLLYIDAGCHLNPRGKKRLVEYFNILSKEDKGIVAFQANAPDNENSTLMYDGRKLFDQPNYRWIKGDLLDYFGVRENAAVVNAQAIGAGIILIRKCDVAQAVIEEWRRIIWERFELLDDSPSYSSNLPGFIEHRHDQAIWTLLCQRYGIRTLSAYEYWYPRDQTSKLSADWDALKEFPIHAKRDKDRGLLRNLFDKFSRLPFLLRRIAVKTGVYNCTNTV